MILAHQVPLGAGQDILNLWFLGYTELCFFEDMQGVLGVYPRFAWNDLLALMTTLLRGGRHPTVVRPNDTVNRAAANQR